MIGSFGVPPHRGLAHPELLREARADNTEIKIPLAPSCLEFVEVFSDQEQID